MRYNPQDEQLRQLRNVTMKPSVLETMFRSFWMALFFAGISAASLSRFFV